MAKKTGNFPEVLAFEKKLVASDAYMYGTKWENRFNEGQVLPLQLIEKSVRGTISNRLKPAVKNDPAKLNAEVEKPNLQRVDACALGADQDTLKLSFTLKVLGHVEIPAICNKSAFRQSYSQAVKTYTEKTGFQELARRYATNIANARFLWRNRVGAESIEVIVKYAEKEWHFNAYEFSLCDFEEQHEEVKELAAVIADTLSNKKEYALLQIDAYVQMGLGQEVYPSEELVFDKGKGDKSKILYQVNKVAAMHSQKIGNALRTIDTWYPAFGTEEGVGPIAIEPYGAVTNLGKAFRNPKEKADFYSLFDRYALGESLDKEEEEHYVMAVLVRGGVFGESGKE